MLTFLVFIKSGMEFIQNFCIKFFILYFTLFESSILNEIPLTTFNFKTPLHFAVNDKNIEVVKLLLKQPNINVDATDDI